MVVQIKKNLSVILGEIRQNFPIKVPQFFLWSIFVKSSGMCTNNNYISFKALMIILALKLEEIQQNYSTVFWIDKFHLCCINVQAKLSCLSHTETS